MSYLHNKTAALTLDGYIKRITLSRGCPQGSILGPILWNVSMEALLRKITPRNIMIQAYEDDIALSVACNSRNDLRSLSEPLLETAHTWGSHRQLTSLHLKSTAVPLKGSLTPGFTLKFGNDRITTTNLLTTLGSPLAWASVSPHT